MRARRLVAVIALIGFGAGLGYVTAQRAQGNASVGGLTAGQGRGGLNSIDPMIV